MILLIDHAEERYGQWYFGTPGHYAVFDAVGRFTGEWVYSLP